jgi:hypothetical protein
MISSRTVRQILAAAIVVSAGLLASPPAVWAQDEIRTEEVRFPSGKTGTTIRGTIAGRASVSYKIGAEAGQVMKIRLRPSNRATYFNVYEPGRGPGDEALAVSESTGPMVPDLNRFEAKLPTSGVYTISVYMVRAAARRNERSTYYLDVSISALGSADKLSPVQADFADGLQGGPDFWEVTGVPPGDALNMRRGPSARDAIVMRFDNGAALRNRGCRMVAGQRWCKVERPDAPSDSGWVLGRYLREGSGPKADSPAATGDALVPGTQFHATGMIPCARNAGQPMGSCRFGVVRQGQGNATVTVFWPDGGSRAIDFEQGQPVRFDWSQTDGDARLSAQRNGDLFILTIGGQRFEIPDAVVSGG